MPHDLHSHQLTTLGARAHQPSASCGCLQMFPLTTERGGPSLHPATLTFPSPEGHQFPACRRARGRHVYPPALPQPHVVPRSPAPAQQGASASPHIRPQAFGPLSAPPSPFAPQTPAGSGAGGQSWLWARSRRRRVAGASPAQPVPPTEPSRLLLRGLHFLRHGAAMYLFSGEPLKLWEAIPVFSIGAGR